MIEIVDSDYDERHAK